MHSHCGMWSARQYGQPEGFVCVCSYLRREGARTMRDGLLSDPPLLWTG